MWRNWKRTLMSGPTTCPSIEATGDYAQAVGDSHLMQEVIKRAESSNAYFTRDDHDWIRFWEEAETQIGERAPRG